MWRLTFGFMNWIKLKKMSSIGKSNDDGWFGDRRWIKTARKIGIASRRSFTQSNERTPINLSKNISHVSVKTLP